MKTRVTSDCSGDHNNEDAIIDRCFNNKVTGTDSLVVTTSTEETSSDLSIDSGLETSLQDFDGHDADIKTVSWKSECLDSFEAINPNVKMCHSDSWRWASSTSGHTRVPSPSIPDPCDTDFYLLDDNDEMDRLADNCRKFCERRQKSPLWLEMCVKDTDAKESTSSKDNNAVNNIDNEENMKNIDNERVKDKKEKIYKEEWSEKLGDLKQELMSLMRVDNTLFDQLLHLHREIRLLREYQYEAYLDEDEEEYEEDEEEDRESLASCSLSLPSSSNHSSPMSTLSTEGHTTVTKQTSGRPNFIRHQVSFPPTARNRRPHSVRYSIGRPLSVSPPSCTGTNNIIIKAQSFGGAPRPPFLRRTATMVEGDTERLISHGSQGSYDSGIHGSDQEVFV